ncbi:hypothetical protein [Flavobacterium anhuiense]|uniref:hypothetical protein n=1 Tax=Flavobacterium anhuiense TaxID=459526 RepID=UPI003D99C2B6
MKKIIVLLFLSINCFAQTGKSNSVMIKAVETYGSFASIERSLHIVNENGDLKTIELEKHNTTGIPKNMITIKNVLDGYLNNNYVIISSTALSFGWNGVFTVENTYILEKK